jgi:hypothetical protein
MKVILTATAAILSMALPSAGWAPHQQPRPFSVVPASSAESEQRTANQVVGRAILSAFITASVWTTSLSMDETSPQFHPPTVAAKEMASGSGSRVNKDAESLLRYGLPINNKDVRQDAAAASSVRAQSRISFRVFD